MKMMKEAGNNYVAPPCPSCIALAKRVKELERERDEWQHTAEMYHEKLDVKCAFIDAIRRK